MLYIKHYVTLLFTLVTSKTFLVLPISKFIFLMQKVLNCNFIHIISDSRENKNQHESVRSGKIEFHSGATASDRM